MYRAIVGLLALTMLAVVPAHAQQCIGTGCEDAAKAQKRGVTGSGSPDPSLICFDVAMTDPRDSVAVTMSYAAPRYCSEDGEGGKKTTCTQTFPASMHGKASAVQRYGTPQAPKVCISRFLLNGATAIQAIPGSKETCANFTTTGIQKLLAGKPVKPACLQARCNPPPPLRRGS